MKLKEFYNIENVYIYSEYVKKHIEGFEIFILKGKQTYLLQIILALKMCLLCFAFQLWYVICFLMVLLFRITKHL